MGFLANFRRTMRLQRLGRALTPSVTSRSLMDTVSGEDLKERALADLVSMCSHDPECAAVMRRHGATWDSLVEAYRMLMAAGAGQWVKAHFVPAAALGYPRLLDYLLTRRESVSDIQLAGELVFLVERGGFA